MMCHNYKFLKSLLLLLFLLGTENICVAGEQKAGHVIFIGLDAWGSYSVDKADMPNVKDLMKKGSYTLQKRTVLPSSSAPNWASMFMGAGPELHGYTEWGSKTPDLPSRVTDEHGIFPTIFGLLRKNCPDAVIGCVYEWDGIRYLIDTLAVNYEKHVAESIREPETTAAYAASYIRQACPNLLCVIFDEPDHIGHSAGHDTPPYYAKMKELDGYIGQILLAVKEAGIWDDTIFIITSDHGGIEKNHGGKTMAEMETPYIMAGKNVKENHQIDNSMMQYDVAATIAYIFGLSQPQVWIGRPMAESFK